jgi:hypothetical protein
MTLVIPNLLHLGKKSGLLWFIVVVAVSRVLYHMVRHSGE